MDDSLESVYFKEQDLRGKNLSKAVHDKPKRYELVPDPPDGGFGWVIVAASAASSFISMMFFANLGVLFVEFVEYFNVTKTYVSWIGSIMVVVRVFLSPIIPWLLRKFGARPVAVVAALLYFLSYLLTSLAPNVPFLFFSLGLLTGISVAPSVIAKQVTVQKYFDKKRSLATSLSIVGTAVGMFAWPPFTRFLIDIYAWRGAILILSGVSLNGLIFVSLLRPPPMKMVLQEQKKPKEPIGNGAASFEDRDGSCHRLSTLFTNYLTYITVLFGHFCMNSGHTVAIIYTPVRANVMGLSKTQGALLLSIIGIFSGIVRVPAGWVGDRKGVNRLILCGAMCCFSGAVTIVSTAFSSFQTMCIYSVLYGIGGAFYVGLTGACLYDVFGLKHISLGYSLFYMATGLSSFATLPIAGYLFDVTGRSFETMVIFGVIQIIGGVLQVVVPFLQAYLGDKKSKENSQATVSKYSVTKI